MSRPPVPSIVEMYETAQPRAEELGIPPEAIIFATHPSTDAMSAASDAAFEATLASTIEGSADHKLKMDTLYGPYDPERRAQLTERAHRAHVARVAADKADQQAEGVRNAYYMLTKGAIWRAYVPGGILAGALVFGGMNFIKSAGGDVTSDPSVLPGRSPVVLDMPGIPDISPTEEIYTELDMKSGKRAVMTIHQGHRTDSAMNQFAPDLHLTGGEYSTDRLVTDKIVAALKQNKKATIQGVEVVGLASDELNGGHLGVPDSANKKLADQRAQVGAQALRDSAKTASLELPTPRTEAKEVLLSPEKADELAAIAKRYGLNTTDLINAYNRDPHVRLTLNDRNILDKLLANNRGVEYKLTLGIQGQKSEIVQETVSTIKKLRLIGIPGELIAAIFAGGLGGLVGLPFSNRIENRLARRRAQKIIRKAEAKLQPVD